RRRDCKQAHLPRAGFAGGARVGRRAGELTKTTQCGFRGIGISSFSAAPHAMHSKVHTCERLRRLCRAMLISRVAPQQRAHGSPAKMSGRLRTEHSSMLSNSENGRKPDLTPATFR